MEGISIETMESSPLLGSNENEKSKVKGDDDGLDSLELKVPEEINSWWMTSIQVVNTTLGSGILAFPLAYARTGAVLFFAQLALFSFLLYADCAMFLDVGEKLGVLHYSQLVRRVFGERVQHLLDFAQSLLNFGALMSYLNTIGTLGSLVVKHHQHDIWLSSYSGFMLFFVILVSPSLLFRSYGEISPISTISLILVGFIVLFVIIVGQVETDVFQMVLAFPDSGLYYFASFGTFSYAISAQYIIFEAYLSTKKEDKQYFLSRSIPLALLVSCILLTLMAVFGYAAFGQDVKSDVLVNFNIAHPIVQVGMLTVCLHLAFYIPNDFIIMRLFAVHGFGFHVLDLSFVNFAIVTAVLYAVPVTLMAIVPEKDVLGVFAYTISLTGDIPTGFTCLLLPALLYLWVFPYKQATTWLWWSAIVGAVVGVVLIFLCPIMDTFLFVKACLSNSGCSSY